jgi:hypothetical protein
MFGLRKLRWLSATLAMLSAHCAPLGMLRPPVPFPEDRRNEIGLGGVVVSPRPYVEEPWTQAGQMWLTRQALPWLQLSAISAFDPRAMAFGLGARALWLRSSRLGAGCDVELGYGWGALGLPVAVRLFGQSWFYASPRVGNYGIEPIFGVPMGLSLNVQHGAFLRLEYQTSWVNLLSYQHRHHLGAALAVDW